MQRTLRPWITAGAAVTAASFIAVTPAAPQLSAVHQLSVRLTSSLPAGVEPFPIVDYNDMISNTTANWTGLTDMYNSITPIWQLPNAVWTDGLTQIQSDLATQSQELANGGQITDPFLANDPVINPVSELSLLSQLLVAPGYASNAASAALTGIGQDMTPYFTDIGTQLTNIYSALPTIYSNAVTEFGTTIPAALASDFNHAITEFGTIGTQLGTTASDTFTGLGNFGTELVNAFTAVLGGASVSTELTALQADLANIVPSADLTALANDFANIVPASEVTTVLNDLASILPTSVQNDFAQIGSDFTNLWNIVYFTPSTLANAYLNGFPVQGTATDPYGLGTDYSLNAPFTSLNNPGITPELGLLTNPDAATTVVSGADGAASSYLGTTPLDTGTLAGLLQIEHTLDNELLTTTASVAGSGVTAPADTGSLLVEGPNSFGIGVDFNNLPVIGTIISGLNSTISGINTVISNVNSYVIDTLGPLITNIVNPFISAVDTAASTVANTINDTVNPFIDAVNGICSAINDIPGVSLHCIGDINLSVPTLSQVSVSIPNIPSIPAIPSDLTTGATQSLPDFTLGGVPQWTYDLTQNEMAILASFSGIAAPPSGILSSADIGNFLTDDPQMNLVSVINTFLTELLGDNGLSLSVTLPVQWTNLLAETLQGVFTQF